VRGPERADGWAWFDAPAAGLDEAPDEVCRSAAACLGTSHGRVVLRHLRRAFLDRRVPPTADDAELRHVEGQRSVVSHLLQLAERGHGGAAPSSTSCPERGSPP
jgi:hypothetical protein